MESSASSEKQFCSSVFPVIAHFKSLLTRERLLFFSRLSSGVQIARPDLLPQQLNEDEITSSSADTTLSATSPVSFQPSNTPVLRYVVQQDLVEFV